MERRVLLPWLLGGALAAGAAALAIRGGGGTVDAGQPPVRPPDPPLPPAPAGAWKGPRLPRLPDDFPEAARRAVREAWPRIESGTPAEAAAALAALTPVAAESPLQGCSPAALEALAPPLYDLITGKEPEPAVAAMKCAGALSRAGGPEGRAALARTGLVERAFAFNAYSGSPALQAETASLLGFAGGDRAQEWLVILLGEGKPLEIRVAAAAGLAEAFALDRRLRADAIAAVGAGAAEGQQDRLRRACIGTIDRSFEAFRPYDPGGLVAPGLSSGDRGVRLAAATFFTNHSLPAQGEALLAALRGADGEFLLVLADALALVRPEGWREALAKRKGEVGK